MEVCDIITTSLREKDAHLQIVSVPLADGGEGTCALLTKLAGGRMVSMKVMDPLLRRIRSGYGISADGKVAYIEMALASGLQLLKEEERNCSITTSYGTGQLIKHAITHGVKEIVLGIGGSATNDAGTGMAQALGYRFKSKSGTMLEAIGKNLVEIAEIDNQDVDPVLMKTKFTVLSDVENPLYGNDGAAFVFAKQKGATASEIKRLDHGLKNFAHLAKSMNCNVEFPGAGAAGGLGAGAKLFLNAQIKSGIDFMIGFTQLEEKISVADLIITGEGKIDAQTLSGKVVKGVADLAHQYGKKLVLVCGVCALNEKQLSQLNTSQLITISDENTSVTESIRNAKSILKEKARQIEIHA